MVYTANSGLMNHEFRFMLSIALRVKLSQAIDLLLWILSDNINTGTGGSILTGIDGSMESVFAGDNWGDVSLFVSYSTRLYLAGHKFNSYAPKAYPTVSILSGS